MGLFSKRPKKDTEKERFLGAKLTEARYSSLQDLVIEEVSLNSDDSKTVTITFTDERVVKIWVANDKVIAAIDSSKPVDFREFLYWIEASDGLKSILISEVNELTPDALPSISTLAPALYKKFIDYVQANTVEVLKWASENYGAYTSVDTQIFKLRRIVDVLAGSGIPLLHLEDVLSARRSEEAELDKRIGTAGIDYRNVTLSLREGSHVAVTPEERLILAASTAVSSLYDTLELSSGFSALTLLQTIQAFGDSDVIDVTFTEDVNSQLPELTDVPIKPYERVFVPTDLGPPLRELATEVFAQSAWKESVLERVSDNEALEERIDAIEAKLIKELSDEFFVEFAELPGDVQSSVRLLLNERTAHNEKRTVILNSISENILVQAGGVDEQLQQVIDEKLAYIAAAVIRFDLIDLTPVENDFELTEPELEFKFSDGVIENDANGQPFVREVTNEDNDYSLEDTVPREFFADDPEIDKAKLASHAFDFDELTESISATEKAARGIKHMPVKRDTLPPIFIEVAKKLELDPFTIGS